MSTHLYQQNNDSLGGVFEETFQEHDECSFAEFLRAVILGLGALLILSAGTFLVFSGIIGTILALLS